MLSFGSGRMGRFFHSFEKGVWVTVSIVDACVDARTGVTVAEARDDALRVCVADAAGGTS